MLIVSPKSTPLVRRPPEGKMVFEVGFEPTPPKRLVP